MKRRFFVIMVLAMYLLTSCKSPAERNYERAKSNAEQANKEYENAKNKAKEFEKDYNEWKELYDKAQAAK